MPELGVIDGGGQQQQPATPPPPPSWAVVSRQVPADLAIDLTTLDDFAAKLDGAAAPLAGILRSAAVRAQVAVFLRYDADAQVQQSRMLREATASNVCLMLAGVASGLVLAGAASRDALGEIWTDRTAIWLGILTLFMGAFAAMFGFWVRDQDRLARWRTRRGEAEIARIGVCQEIAAQAGKTTPETALVALAVLGRGFLDQQRAWLGKRAKEHRRSSEWTTVWGGIGTALAFIGGSGAVIAGWVKGSAWVAIAGVIAAAVAAYATNREALRRDRANADRYEKTQVALDGLAARTDAIAAEIEAGKPEALVAFVEAFTDQLATEHKQWLEGTAQAESALSKLDDRLSQITQRPKQASDGPRLPGG